MIKGPGQIGAREKPCEPLDRLLAGYSFSNGDSVVRHLHRSACMTTRSGVGSCLAVRLSEASMLHDKVKNEKHLEIMQDAYSPAVKTLPAVSGKCCTGSWWCAGLSSISSQV